MARARLSWADKQERESRKGPKSGSVSARSGTKPVNHEESRLQRAVIAVLSYWADQYEMPQLAWVFHVPNGGKRVGAERFIFQAEGVRPGISDLVYPFAGARGQYTGAYQELKSSTGRLRPTQKEFLKFAASKGGACNVSNTLISALVFWKWYFAVPVYDAVMVNQATSLSGDVPLGELETVTLWTG